MTIKALLLGAALLTSVAAQAFTVTNSVGGNGSVAVGPAPYTFTLTGADNHAVGNVLKYSTVAALASTITGNFFYKTFDRDGSNFDRAGYFVNSTFTQLSAAGIPKFASNSGAFSFAVAAGNTYGFYINSTDTQLGVATLSVGGVPEPMTWALMIGGLAMTGIAMRRKVALAA